MHALDLKRFPANPTSHLGIAQTRNLPNYRVEKKKTLLILAFSLAMRACHGRMRNVCLEDMFRLRPTAIVTWRIAIFEYLPVTNWDNTILEKHFWIILIKKDYSENCLGNKRNRH